MTIVIKQSEFRYLILGVALNRLVINWLTTAVAKLSYVVQR